LRENLGLTGAKAGCGIGRCGACTVHLDGEAVRSCVTPVEQAVGRRVRTVEGLAGEGLHPVQEAWVLEDVSQCGYCQTGQIMTAAALLAAHPDPTDEEIEQAMEGVLCRCGTYPRIRRAVRRATEIFAGRQQEEPFPGPALAEALLVGGSDVRAVGPRVRELSAPFAPNPWVRVHADGTAAILVAKSEMGQGILTPLAAAVADELGADWARVRIEPAPAGPEYADPVMGRQTTGGSTSVRFNLDVLRRAGAEARAGLIAAAAETWDVDPATCSVRDGRVVHPPSGRALPFGELAATAAGLPAPERSAFKTDAELRLLGTPLARADARPKAEGRALFGLDVRLPGQLTAVVARCPVFGGKLTRFDAGSALAVPGVRRVHEVSAGVAVVAESFRAAVRGREALKIEWDKGPLAGLGHDALRASLREAAAGAGRVAQSRGDAPGALGRADRIVEAEYTLPYLAHAPMEPMNCTAWVRPDRCEIWAPTQHQTAVREAAAEASGLPLEAVQVHTTFLGGGFGRRLEADYATEATEISRVVEAPVQVVWTREDDLGHDFYRPIAHHRLRAGLGPDGAPVAWFHRVATPSIFARFTQATGEGGVDGASSRGKIDSSSIEGAVDLPYRFPDLRVEWVPWEPGVPVGFWRSVGHSHTAFAVECFLDEVASTAGIDPLELRRSLLREAPRHRAVLETVVARADWGRPLPQGRGRGLALHESFGSIVAQVAEVSTANGKLRVDRVVCAVDCGAVANPAGAEAQMEGGVLFGLSAALREAITIRGGGVHERNFDAYELLRFGDAPEVEVHIVPSREPPGGAGEPGVPPIAPAVANAMYAATGERLRHLPFLRASSRIEQ
jgi:isoquinoline 1-oxidoreductase beta subunit